MEPAKNPQKSGGFVLPNGPAGQPAGGLGRPSVIPAPSGEQSSQNFPTPPVREPVVVMGGVPVDDPEPEKPSAQPASRERSGEKPAAAAPHQEKPAPVPPVPEPVRRRKRPVMASSGQMVAVLVLGILLAFCLGTLAGVVASYAMWKSDAPVSRQEQQNQLYEPQNRIPEGNGTAEATEPVEDTQPTEENPTQPDETTPTETNPSVTESTEQPTEPQPTEPQPTETQPTEPEPDTSEYFFYDSDSRYLTYEDCWYLTRWELVLARNEIFARHGRLFANEDIQNYFDGCSWYEGTISPEYFDSSVFNDYERYNINFLKSIEDSL